MFTLCATWRRICGTTCEGMKRLIGWEYRQVTLRSEAQILQSLNDIWGDPPASGKHNPRGILVQYWVQACSLQESWWHSQVLDLIFSFCKHFLYLVIMNTYAFIKFFFLLSQTGVHFVIQWDDSRSWLFSLVIVYIILAAGCIWITWVWFGY